MVKPAGEYIVGAGEEEDFLSPLPIYLIPGIEREELKRLREFNLTRAGDLLHLSVEQLNVLIGKQGFSLYNAVRGIDPSPVFPVDEKPPTVSAGHGFGNDTNDVARVESVLYRLVEQAGAETRRRVCGKQLSETTTEKSQCPNPPGRRCRAAICQGSFRQYPSSAIPRLLSLRISSHGKPSCHR